MNDSGNVFWLWGLLGKLHPLVVHFPIGVLVVALLLELMAWKRKAVDFLAAIRVLIVVGAISAVAAVILGLLLSYSEEYSSPVLPVHQWLGIATMAISIVTAMSYFRSSRSAQRTLLIMTVSGVLVAGHFGAVLTHGED